MDKKKSSKIKEEDKLKYEVAEELGLLDKVLKEGWRGLTAKETGKIGGIMTKKKKEEKELQGIVDTMKFEDSPKC